MQPITIITATLNAEKHLPRLIDSLLAQTDRDFMWIVSDGESIDHTRVMVANSGLSCQIINRRDFGIYDALNHAVMAVSDGYYLVVGADDWLEPSAIANYKAAAQAAGEPDFVAAGIRQAGRNVLPRKGWGWLYGMPGVASSHSVGLLIRRTNHDRFGFYSSRFPIAADQLFVKGALLSGASIVHVPFIAGEFGIEGTSSTDSLGTLTELFRVQVRTEKNAALQYILFVIRLIKYFLVSFLAGKGGR